MLIAIALTLIACVPWANKYIPYIDTIGPEIDAWKVKPQNDPHYQYRYNIILFGFILSGLSVFPLVASFFHKKENLDSKVFNAVTFLLIITLGIKKYPYWANGLYHVFSTGSVSTAYDPKAILPYIEFGEIWVNTAFYIFLLCFIMIPTIFFRLAFNVFRFFDHRPSRYDILTVAALILLIISFLGTPNYLSWLAD